MGIDVWIMVDGEMDLEERWLERLSSLSENPTPDARDRFIREMSAEMNGPKHLRECYGGGPYAIKMLCREAFESPNRQSRIPAAVLRERLADVTSPATRFESGDHLMASLVTRLESGGGRCERFVSDAHTDPMTVEEMTVEEAIHRRYARDPQFLQSQLARFRAFVEFAEAEEARTGVPCLITASG